MYALFSNRLIVIALAVLGLCFFLAVLSRSNNYSPIDHRVLPNSYQLPLLSSLGCPTCDCNSTQSNVPRVMPAVFDPSPEASVPVVPPTPTNHPPVTVILLDTRLIDLADIYLQSTLLGYPIIAFENDLDAHPPPYSNLIRKHKKFFEWATDRVNKGLAKEDELYLFLDSRDTILQKEGDYLFERWNREFLRASFILGGEPTCWPGHHRDEYPPSGDPFDIAPFVNSGYFLANAQGTADFAKLYNEELKNPDCYEFTDQCYFHRVLLHSKFAYPLDRRAYLFVSMTAPVLDFGDLPGFELRRAKSAIERVFWHKQRKVFGRIDVPIEPAVAHYNGLGDDLPWFTQQVKNANLPNLLNQYGRKYFDESTAEFMFYKEIREHTLHVQCQKFGHRWNEENFLKHLTVYFRDPISEEEHLKRKRELFQAADKRRQSINCGSA